jgi:fumarate hydratase class I
MGERTLDACGKYGCVYLHAIGGAAQVLAECVKRVRNVYMKEEFGSPEAIWELEVENFPAVVTMDSHGGSLHRDVLRTSQEALASRL